MVISTDTQVIINFISKSVDNEHQKTLTNKGALFLWLGLPLALILANPSRNVTEELFETTVTQQ